MKRIIEKKIRVKSALKVFEKHFKSIYTFSFFSIFIIVIDNDGS